MNMAIVITVVASLIIGGIVLAIIVSRMLRKEDGIELVQGKLENSDSAIADAMSYLKVTNEWSK